MRKKIVAGNWKMNTTIAEGEFLVKQLVFLKGELNLECDLVVAPPFTHLVTVANMLKDTDIALSAQNCADQESGAYTGEVSIKMLSSVGCKYVILGHSERREYYGENSETLLKKVNLAINAGIVPIFCVGEKLDERESNRHFEVVAEQLKEVLFKLRGVEFANVVVAYEPMSVVFLALILLYVAFKLVGNNSIRRNKQRAVETAEKEGVEITSQEDSNAEQLAAIAAALHTYLEESEVHDLENTILTISKVTKHYSPWSSKIYTLRETPQKK